VAVTIATVPFFLPYLALRNLQASTRSLPEVARYSADVYSYLTAFSDHPIWGNAIQAFPKPEGQLFPGIAAVILGAIGIVFRWPGGSKEPPLRTPEASRTGSRVSRRGRPAMSALFAVIAGIHIVLFVVVLFVRRFALDVGGVVLRVSDATQLLLRAVVAGALVLVFNPRARARFGASLWPHRAWLIALLAAVWLSLGPSPASMGRPLDLASPYRVLYDVVPGFDGVRAPSRFWMVGLLALSVLGGFGAAALLRRPAGRAALALAWVVCLAEARVAPFVVNGMSPVEGFRGPEPRLQTGAPPIYAAVSQQPATTVLAELPLGQPDFDLRAMYYSTFHWRKLLNGYSGFMPVHYGPLVAALGAPEPDGDNAWTTLRKAGATAVIVHEGAYEHGAGARLSLALREHGAREVTRDGSDVLFALSPEP
jgi:hypothetical protein